MILLRNYLVVVVASNILMGVLAINTCSDKLNYRELCPNPMFVSSGGGGGGGSVPDGDVTINLRSGHSSSQCEFYKDANEVSVIQGIHVSEQPWSFYGSSTCNHAVKLILDPLDGRGSNSNNYFYREGNREVCKKNLGMKVHDDVYLWHNYTITSDQLGFTDIITNYGHSSSDLLCSHRPKYILMLFLTSRYSKCSLLIQQYKLDDQSQGCDAILRDPTPSYKFCGAYPCSQEKSLLQEMKLVVRRVPSNVHNPRQVLIPAPVSSAEEDSTPHNSGQPDHGGQGHTNQGQGHGFKPHSSNPFDPKNIPPSAQAPTIFMTPDKDTSTEDPSAVTHNQKPIDWNEWIVRMFFPGFGILFIFLLLSILKARYAEEICGRVHHNHNVYQGSTISMDKQGLPM